MTAFLPAALRRRFPPVTAVPQYFLEGGRALRPARSSCTRLGRAGVADLQGRRNSRAPTCWRSWHHHPAAGQPDDPRTPITCLSTGASPSRTLCAPAPSPEHLSTTASASVMLFWRIKDSESNTGPEKAHPRGHFSLGTSYRRTLVYGNANKWRESWRPSVP